jgi:hypothetical protein
VLARAIEEVGLPTVAIVLIREHAQRVKPPRALWVPFPFGFALGKPDDPPFQHEVLSAALGLLSVDTGPVLVDFPDDTDAPPSLLLASSAQVDVAKGTADPADEITALRGYYERWVQENGDRTMVGLSGVPQRRFRGLVRYLQSFLTDRPVSYELAPTDMPVGRFLRLASDDLKAFYMEARFCQRPEQKDNDLQRWFWTETAMGQLLASLAGKLTEDGDAGTAWGIAR